VSHSSIHHVAILHYGMGLILALDSHTYVRLGAIRSTSKGVLKPPKKVFSVAAQLLSFTKLTRYSSSSM